MITSKQAIKGCLIYTPKHQIHRAAVTSRETPERLVDGYNYIKNRTDILDSFELVEDFPPATEEDILRIHEKPYVEFMKNYCEKGGGFLGDSTYVQKGTCKAARYSAGGAIEACRRVMGDDDVSFALIRPPGHHAMPDRHGGYCIFNNAAIAARWLQDQGMKKIMILDWDGHAANGTMRIFYEDPTVLTISIHRNPEGFYPHDGYIHQVGRGAGMGHSVNVCLPHGAGDKEFKMACDQIVFPLIREFLPDFVIGCNGFDSHHSDEVVRLRYTSKSYYFIAKRLSEMYNGRLALIMEGGYKKFNGKLLHSILSGLSGKDNPVEELDDNLSRSLMQMTNIFKETEDHLDRLKSTLSDYPLGRRAFVE